MKVSGNGKSGGVHGARGSREKGGASGAFSVSGAGSASAAPATATGETASATALGALIALQSETGGRSRNRAQAERLLMLLERLRDGLLSGRVMTQDLAAIRDAALAKLDDPDDRIAAIYGEIALRARVELAKIGQ